MTNERDRVLCVSLTEAEWQAFVARHPQPVVWLREQILGQLGSERATTPSHEPALAGTPPASVR